MIEKNVEDVVINVDEGNRQLEKGVKFKVCERGRESVCVCERERETSLIHPTMHYIIFVSFSLKGLAKADIEVV